MDTDNKTWFYIQSTKTGHVIAASRHIQSDGLPPLQSQVHVYAPLQTCGELWTWDGQFIRNKATGLVLDIREGRLRLIEDTEICLHQEKPLEEASNQLWGQRDATSSQGKLIYSLSNADWTLMQDGDKLLLYPQEPSDTWHLIDQASFTPTAASTSATTKRNDSVAPDLSSGSSFDARFIQGGLSPAKY